VLGEPAAGGAGRRGGGGAVLPGRARPTCGDGTAAPHVEPWNLQKMWGFNVKKWWSELGMRQKCQNGIQPVNHPIHQPFGVILDPK